MQHWSHLKLCSKEPPSHLFSISESSKAQTWRWLRDPSICHWTFTLRGPVQGPASHRCDTVLLLPHSSSVAHWGVMRKLPEKRPPGFSCVFTSVDISQEVVQTERTSPKQQLDCMKNWNHLKALGLSNGMHVKLDNSVWGIFWKLCFTRPYLSFRKRIRLRTRANVIADRVIIFLNLTCHKHFSVLTVLIFILLCLEEWGRRAYFCNFSSFKQLTYVRFSNNFQQIKQSCQGLVKSSPLFHVCTNYTSSPMILCTFNH